MKPTAKSIANASDWLMRELYDELPSPDPDEFTPEITRFLIKGVRLMNGTAGYKTARRTRHYVRRYYCSTLQQKHHTAQDMAWLLYQMSRAVIMACGLSPNMSPEARLIDSHYQALGDGVRRMLSQAGQLERYHHLATAHFCSPCLDCSLN